MRIFYDLVLALDIVLYHIELSSGVPPKTKDFLTNFGISNEHANRQESSSGMPPKTKDFLTNFGISNEHANRAEISSGTTPETRDFLANFGTSNKHADNQESSTQSEGSRDCAIIPSVAGTSYSSGRNPPPDRSPNPDRSRSRSPHVSFNSSESSPPAGSSDRSRCIVPPTRLPSYQRKGFGLEHLPFIRLTSKSNPNWEFEFRRYTFSADKELKLRVRDHTYEPVPTQEQIVISTSDGEIFAILESTTVLAGIYVVYDKSLEAKRAKVNMENGTVTLLSKKEIDVTPVGRLRPIFRYFKTKRLKSV